jgi:AIPR protein
MDRITKTLVEDFLDSLELKPGEPSSDFEKFVNYTIISKEYTKTFDVDTVTVGSGNDTGIDGIGIIVNGHLIDYVDEIDDLLEKNGYLEATYVFIQSKTSSGFNGSEINNFAFGVKDFFSEQPGLVRNEDIAKCVEISDYLLRKASYFRENPICKMYFVTTGSWSEDQNHVAIIENAKRELKAFNIFESISFFPFGANEIGKLYRQSKSSISATFIFANKVTLPDLPGITEAYYGILPFSEFKNLLVDEDDKILNIFDDNVRDFQGENNPVNQVIRGTITGDKSELFTVLNNGVTIVANSLRPSGNNFTVTDYQIVNGCQTSNVLFNQRHSEAVQKLGIPLKLIVTQDEDIKSQITIATNSQTAIRGEQLAALSDFQRNLERYYSSVEDIEKLFYERRAKQYSSDSSVNKTKVITIPIQIKSFSAMYLKNPHLVTSFFGSIVKKLDTDGSQIFKQDHQHVPYYTSGLAYYRLDSFLRSKNTEFNIDSKFKKVKFHLLMLFRLIVQPDDIPPMNSARKTEIYCQPILDVLRDPSDCLDKFQQAASILEKAEMDVQSREHVKQARITEALIKEFEKMYR